MKTVAYFLVAYWFVHLGLGVGAFYAALRLWPMRRNPYVLNVVIYLQAAAIGVIMAIVLVFMARGVKLTWKFTLTWFIGTMLMDAVRVPLVWFVLKGNGQPQVKPPSELLIEK